MHQIKIFKSLESELTSLENDVNCWLAETGGRIVHMFGNIAQQSTTLNGKPIGLSQSDFIPSDVLLVVVYDKIS